MSEHDQKSRLLMRLDHGTQYRVSGNAGGHRMRRRDGFRAGAAEHAWRPHLPPSPLPLPHGERKGEDMARERKNIGNLLRNGRTGTVRAR